MMKGSSSGGGERVSAAVEVAVVVVMKGKKEVAVVVVFSSIVKEEVAMVVIYNKGAIGENRTWRRSFEIALASKRKLGFVTGGVKRDNNDKVKQESWDTCNFMVISWILASVTDPIKKSVMFMNDSVQIWKHLEMRFSITNGAKKSSLNKQLYETKQENKTVSEYYTNMRALWMELEDLNIVPAITNVTPEVNAFINALNEQKEELKLFQFLNGLDDQYGAQRSQILMMSKLSTVDEACSMIQQEESQREDTLRKSVGHVEPVESLGIPMKNAGPLLVFQQEEEKIRKEGLENANQLEQLLRMLPVPLKGGEGDSNDECEANFVEIAECNLVQTKNSEWIVDSGATHHMTGNYALMRNTRESLSHLKINLPNGQTSIVTHKGEVVLANEMSLNNVMYIPAFNHNLVSVQKLTEEEDCKIIFHSRYCIIQDNNSEKVRGVAKGNKGVYYLMNEPLTEVIDNLKRSLKKKEADDRNKCMAGNSELNVPTQVKNVTRVNHTTLWHLRLGHAPLERIQKINGLKGFDKCKAEECLVCPVAKFTRFPFTQSRSCAQEPFELVHIDTWGSYRVQTREGYKYFFAIVDDYTRVTWIHLMKHKNEAVSVLEKFINMANTHYNKKVKRLRSDNATEMDDTQCKHIYDKFGVLHETTCVDRPQ
ncbi:Retrovirus-related Pol polyprotein from transposon TNT 1-94 [Bienertia sinuspersici]